MSKFRKVSVVNPTLSFPFSRKFSFFISRLFWLWSTAANILSFFSGLFSLSFFEVFYFISRHLALVFGNFAFGPPSWRNRSSCPESRITRKNYLSPMVVIFFYDPRRLFFRSVSGSIGCMTMLY